MIRIIRKIAAVLGLWLSSLLLPHKPRGKEGPVSSTNTEVRHDIGLSGRLLVIKRTVREAMWLLVYKKDRQNNKNAR